MKAPDKIYLAWEYSEIDTLPPGVTTKQVFGKDVAYIRKDALIEWASGEIKRLKQGCKEKWLDGKVPYGGVLAMQNLIDKLNSL